MYNNTNTRIDNVFSESEIKTIIEYFSTQPVSSLYKPNQTLNKNLDYQIEGSLINKMVKPKISNILHDDTHEFFGGAYKEYSKPYTLHIDNYLPTASEVFLRKRKHEKVFLIPLISGENLKTVIFDISLPPLEHPFHVGSSMEDRVNILKSFETQTNNGLDVNEFDHLEEPLKKYVDRIPLNSVLEWKLGSVITWNLDSLHCSTNFEKFGIIKKFIVVMVN